MLSRETASTSPITAGSAACARRSESRNIDHKSRRGAINGRHDYRVSPRRLRATEARASIAALSAVASPASAAMPLASSPLP